MNVLLFNLAMDADDPALGHGTAWANALARRCEHVSVITMRAGRLALEPNVDVHTLGKERGLSEPRRLALFYRLVRSALRQRRIDACFAHMAPLFAILFAPLAKLNRIPILLWYAHASVTPTLRLAHAFADRCVTATSDGFRLPSEKLFVIGHGVDVERFRPPATTGPSYDSTAVSVGRIAPIKRIDEMIEAIAVSRDERETAVQLRLFGAPSTADDRRYEAGLTQLAHNRGLGREVSFEGPLPFGEVPTAYHAGAVFLNLSETGAIDKAILEAMASGCIPVSRNASYAAIARENGLEALVPDRGAASVADRLVGLLERPADERSSIATRLRQIVIEEHSLDDLADSVITHLTDLAVQPHPTRSARASR
jgi:glycosyltransferase involved in cell wall biosynthesis